MINNNITLFTQNNFLLIHFVSFFTNLKLKMQWGFYIKDILYSSHSQSLEHIVLCTKKVTNNKY